MKQNFLKIICPVSFFFIAEICFGQVNFTNSNLPIVVINTAGQTIQDDPKITCDMGIIWNGEGNRNFLTDSFNNYSGKIGIEIRGSTSQQYPKKSYGVETRDAVGNNLNVSLLGLPKENDWILYGAYPDKSLMRNEITYSIFGQMQPWSPRYVYCELVINGEYLGVYTLIEKIKRDNDRIDIEELEPNQNSGDLLTGGYVIKIDKRTGSSNIPWSSLHQNKLEFLYHDPQYDELSPAQRKYIKDYLSAFENVIYSPGFTDTISGYRAFINVESFIDFMIMEEFGRTVDGYRSSSFMYKDRDSKGGKLTCGPMWDFNLSYGNADYCFGYETTGWQYNFANVCGNRFDVLPPDWWPRLLEDPSFADQLQCRWRDLRSSILSTASINNRIDSTALILAESQERNFKKWPILGKYIKWNFFVGETFEEEVEFLKEWIESRSEYLDQNFPGSCSDGTLVKSPKEESVKLYPNPTNGYLESNFPVNSDTEIKIFNIAGKKVKFEIFDDKIDISKLSKGLYLVNFRNHFFKVVKI